MHLLGRDLPVVEQNGNAYALDHGKPASPRPARAYVEKAFGKHLPAVRRAMEALADSLPPEELNRIDLRSTNGSGRRCPPAPRAGARRVSSTLS